MSKTTTLPKGFTVGNCNCGRKNVKLVDEFGQCGRCTFENGVKILKESKT